MGAKESPGRRTQPGLGKCSRRYARRSGSYPRKVEGGLARRGALLPNRGIDSRPRLRVALPPYNLAARLTPGRLSFGPSKNDPECPNAGNQQNGERRPIRVILKYNHCRQVYLEKRGPSPAVTTLAVA